MGNPKSGTTAVAAFVARRSGLQVTHEVPYLFGAKLIEVRRGNLSFGRVVARNRRAFSRPIIKHATLSLIDREVMAYFPGARFLMVVRDPRASVRSTLDRLGLPGDLQSLPSEAIASVPTAWQETLDPASADLPDGNYVETLARRWCLGVAPCLLNPERYVVARYEDVMAKGLGEIDRVVAELGIALPHDAEEPHWGEGLQPRGANRDTSWHEFFGQTNLAAINHVCAKLMPKFGYSVESTGPEETSVRPGGK